MVRLTAALSAVLFLAFALAGLALVPAPQPASAAPADPPAGRSAAADPPAAAALEAAPAADEVDIYMSDVSGSPRRNFPKHTTGVYAVVAFEGAQNERYMVQLRDLSGIPVKLQTVQINGTGAVSVAITTSDFVAAYRSRVDAQAAVVRESIDQAAENCEDVPPVPTVWPPPPPVVPTTAPGQPTATPPRPDPYEGWLQDTLDAVGSARSSSAELTRTLQAVAGLPDLADVPGARANLNEARAELTLAEAELGAAVQKIKPVAPPPERGNTPEPAPRPDPDAGCQLIRSAKARIDLALAKTAAAMAAIPADTSAWTIPPTAARFEGNNFVSCLQYKTDLLQVDSQTGRPGDTPVNATLWTVGDPGLPALMFPSPELVDRGNVGAIGLSFPEASSSLFARSVMVPGVAHTATLRAFVTDRACIPVDGVPLTFGVDPSTAGSVSPALVMLDDGVATAVLEAGDSAARNATARAIVCVSPCTNPSTPPGPGENPGYAMGSARFDVIGRASEDRMRVIVTPKLINALAGERAGITVQVRDENGNAVADGTACTVQIATGDPGQLAFDRQRMVGGRPVGDSERVVLAKSSGDMVITQDGYTRIRESADPGYMNRPELYLVSGGETGAVTIQAECDGARADSNDDRTGEKTILIVSLVKIHLPVAHKYYDVHAVPTYLIIPTVTPTASP